MKRKSVLFLALLLLGIPVLTACQHQTEKQIIRVGHNQSNVHPTHIGMQAFEKYVEAHLGDKYDVEVFPSELLGSQNEMVQLTQTGAITFVVASNSLLETFSKDYSIFNLPYLFSSSEAYHAAMDDPAVYGPIFESTKQSGIQALTWIDAGSRSFYTIDRPIMKPEDLKGLKIRVQQSPTNVKMMELLGGSATPMGFGEVYTALQSKMLDGAENNEMALKDNGHGDVCKYYSYDLHQMIPDFFLVNSSFWEALSAEDRAVFEEACKVMNQVEREAWSKGIEEAKIYAKEKQGVQFFYPDVQAFQEVLMPMHEQFLAANPKLQAVYDLLQKHNQEALKETAEANSEAPTELATEAEASSEAARKGETASKAEATSVQDATKTQESSSEVNHG